MKKLATGILVAMLLFASITQAQTSQKADSAALAKQKAQEEKTVAAVNALIDYVGKYTTKTDSTAQTADTSASKHASWGGVLEKSLDMLSGAISKIAETLEQAAPAVWEIMVRQQYAKAISGLAVPFIFLMFFLFFHRFINKVWTPASDTTFDTMVNDGRTPTTKYDKGYGWGWRVAITRGVPFLGCIISSGFLISALQDAVLYTMNPYYFAIRDLVVLLLGNNHGM